MTISYVLAPEPIWYIVGLDGLAAGGAQLFTYDSLTREPRDTYQDAGGFAANTNPIIFGLNGTFPKPIYWQIDPSDPNGYYIEVYDALGNLLWEADNFPGGTGGGGGDVTTLIPVQNYITNNQFINHIPSTPSPIGTTVQIIASSNHKGFTPSTNSASTCLVGMYGVLGPDIYFSKSNTNSTDQITFPVFSLSGSQLVSGSITDVTPAEYVRYECTIAGSPAESYKNFQFPITQKVKNLSNQPMTFTLWAKVTSTPVSINIYSRQYYGSGTSATVESTSTRVLQDTYVLSTSWTKFVTNFTMPDVSGNSIGTPGLQTDDDAVYMQIEMPLGALCDVQFTKPCLYLGTFSPDVEFDSYDEIDSIDQTPRTGDVKTSLQGFAPLGWLPMNDTTIGNTGSGATTAGDFTFQLYATIYTSVSDTWAPISGGRTSPGNSIANAISDFLAGKTLSLPLSLGRALAGAGSGSGLPTYVLGQNAGAPSTNVTLIAANLPPHTHTVSSQYDTTTTGASNVIALGQTNRGNYSSFTVGNGPGTSTPFTVPTVSPSSFFNIFIKL